MILTDYALHNNIKISLEAGLGVLVTKTKKDKKNKLKSTKKVRLKKIPLLNWSALPHSPYSPDLIPTDFSPYLFLRNCF